MGMAASQARLLALTARIHDVEYQAQSIQNAKVQLSTQQDQVYREYLDALDATTLTIKTATANVPATFNNLCSHNRLPLGSLDQSYAIRDKYGRLIVEDEIAKNYKEFKASGFSNEAYGISAPEAFALYMLDRNNGIRGNDVTNIRNAEADAYQTLIEDGKNTQLTNLLESMWGLIGESADSHNVQDIYQIHNELVSRRNSKEITEDEYREKSEQFENKLGKFLYQMYNAKTTDDDGDVLYGAQLVYENAEAAGEREIFAEDLDMTLFSYYCNIYNQIQTCGDCVSINEYNGVLKDGDAATNSDFLKEKIESGEFTIETVKDNRDGTVTMQGTSTSSDDKLGLTATTEIDNKALKKAEAKYEKSLKDIDRKDKAYDMTLSKLETERTALTTEYDSVKKVIQDNIDRTFGIFS